MVASHSVTEDLPSVAPLSTPTVTAAAFSVKLLEPPETELSKPQLPERTISPTQDTRFTDSPDNFLLSETLEKT